MEVEEEVEVLVEVRKAICVVCYSDCCFENDDLRFNPSFLEFLKDLEGFGGNGGSGLKDRLLYGFDKKFRKKLGLCDECLLLIDECVEMRGDVRKTEGRVIELQEDMLWELRALQEGMGNLYGMMRRVEKNVMRMDGRRLKDLNRKRGTQTRTDGGGDDRNELLIFRDKISEVVADLGKFRGDLNEKFSANQKKGEGEEILLMKPYDVKEQPVDLDEYEDDLIDFHLEDLQEDPDLSINSIMEVEVESVKLSTNSDSEYEDFLPATPIASGTASNKGPDLNDVPLAKRKRIRTKTKLRVTTSSEDEDASPPSSDEGPDLDDVPLAKSMRKRTKTKTKLKVISSSEEEDAPPPSSDEGPDLDDEPLAKRKRIRTKTKLRVTTSSEDEDAPPPSSDEGPDLDDVPLAKSMRKRTKTKTKLKVISSSEDEDAPPPSSDEGPDPDDEPLAKGMRKRTKTKLRVTTSSEDEDASPPSSTPIKKKQSVRKSRSKYQASNLNFPGTSSIEKAVIKSVMRRYMRYTNNQDKDNLSRIFEDSQPNSLDPNLPVNTRFPFRYDDSTRKITISDIEVTLQGNIFSCTLCNFQTPSGENRPKKIIDYIYNHVGSKHLDAFQCHLCYKQYSSKKKFLEHLMAHKKTESRTCDICAKPLGNREALFKHKWLHLNSEEQQEALKNGTAPYAYRIKMKQKEADPLAKETFTCSICEKTFGNRLNLTKHEESHYEELTVCPKCGKSMRRKSYQNYHMKYACPLEKYEQNLKRVNCLECEATFQTKAGLRVHVRRTHSKDAVERPHLCSTCGTGYKTEADMKQHMKTHSEVMAWKCDKCGKGFNMKRYWQRHKCKVRNGKVIKIKKTKPISEEPNCKMEIESINYSEEA